AKADAKKAKATKKSAAKASSVVAKINAAERAPAQTSHSAASGIKKKSGRGEAPAIVDPAAARLGHRAPMPCIINPMLATLVDGPFDDQQWLYEIKWDGYRAIAFLDGGSVRLDSRSQNDLTAAYPELHSIGDCVKANNAILDG